MEKEKAALSLIHSTLGRTRFRLLSEEKTLPKLEGFLQISGVEEVVFRKMTNSLIIYYQQRLTTDDLISKLKEKFPQIKFSKETKMAVKDEDGKYSADSLAALFAGLGKKANHGVRRGTGDTTSIYSLVPTLILAWAFIELIRRPKIPPWYNLINVSKAIHGYLDLIKS